jgi:hypothetical protein
VNVGIAALLIVFAHAHPRAADAIGVDDMRNPMVDRLAAVNLSACAAAASKAGQIARPISTAERSALLASRPLLNVLSHNVLSHFPANQTAAKMMKDPRPPYPARPRDGWHFSAMECISPEPREVVRVAHEELDQPTSRRRPTPESDRWCSSR